MAGKLAYLVNGGAIAIADRIVERVLLRERRGSRFLHAGDLDRGDVLGGTLSPAVGCVIPGNPRSDRILTRAAPGSSPMPELDPPLDRPDPFRDSGTVFILGELVGWGVMKSQDVAGDQGRFELPPDVSFRKQRLNDGWAYVFRHRTLGELGRILVQDTGDGHSRISCEVVGDLADPMTVMRGEVFKPLGLDLARRLKRSPARSPSPWRTHRHPLRRARDVIESRLIPCDHCGNSGAPHLRSRGQRPGPVEDYARKMYAEYAPGLNVAVSWIIGPALGGGPGDGPSGGYSQGFAKTNRDRAIRPAEFNPIIDHLATNHCSPAGR